MKSILLALANSIAARYGFVLIESGEFSQQMQDLGDAQQRLNDVVRESQYSKFQQQQLDLTLAAALIQYAGGAIRLNPSTLARMQVRGYTVTRDIDPVTGEVLYRAITHDPPPSAMQVGGSA